MECAGEHGLGGSDNVKEERKGVKRGEGGFWSKRISLGGIMKLVTHSRRGKINEKGGGNEHGSGLYAN